MLEVWQAFTSFILAHQDWVWGISWTILALGVLQNIVYFLQLPAAYLELKKHAQTKDQESSWQLLLSDVVMPISIVLPAYNEQETIVESVRATMALRYPDFEVIVVNDGSKDNTLQVLTEAFNLVPTHRATPKKVNHKPVRGLYKSEDYPDLLVVDKENGGSKADASNAGLAHSRKDLFCVVDADSLLEGDALLRAIRPFMEDKDMVAVGGTIRVLNGAEVSAGRVKSVALPANFLARIQVLEYIRAFLMARLAWSRWGMLGLISGAFGVFKRDLAVELGGFPTDTVGEDYDLVMKMHYHLCRRKRPYTMRYVPEPVCWTQAPESLKVLAMQRKRWQRSALEVFFKHKTMMLNPRYGKIGLLTFPYNFIVDVLGPIAELVGYIFIPIFYFMGALNTEFMLAFVAMFFIYGVFISIGSLVLEEMELKRVPRPRDLASLTVVAIAENFGYRQLNNLWRIAGWWQFIRRDKSWGEMARTPLNKK